MNTLEKFKKAEFIFFEYKGFNSLFMVYEHIVDEKIDLIPLYNGIKAEQINEFRKVILENPDHIYASIVVAYKLEQRNDSLEEIAYFHQESKLSKANLTKEEVILYLEGKINAQISNKLGDIRKLTEEINELMLENPTLNLEQLKRYVQKSDKQL